MTAAGRFDNQLVGYALRHLGDLDRARDVVQDTFLALCQEDRESVEDHLSAWLFAVCRNRCLDVLRKEKRMSPLTSTTATVPESSSASPPAVVEAREESARVLQVLQTLPPRQQEVLRLKLKHELSYKEIARVVGISVSNVGYQIHVGLKTLRERLAAPGLGDAVVEETS
jgi:RNA polymerase sigma-70 factor (ECF subfamily)